MVKANDVEAGDHLLSGAINSGKLLYDFKKKPAMRELKPLNVLDITFVFHPIEAAQPLIGGSPEARTFARLDKRPLWARPQWLVFTAIECPSIRHQRMREVEAQP